MKAETFECACGHKLTGRKITLDSKDTKSQPVKISFSIFGSLAGFKG